MLVFYNIQWDLDDDDIDISLPDKYEFPDIYDIDEAVEYLSDLCGFCIIQFKVAVGLCTYPLDDDDYCLYFEVTYNWMVSCLEKIGVFDFYKDYEDFINNYTWDETWPIYEQANLENVVIKEVYEK